ncbi:hypothetical protein HHK36_016037 [Tetracentron sinense]|uniref:Uncharacterized protein n=1 Tax=Tetracentron sinense TaxID=13715 RepID=A0A834YZ06_TETSI|nr:hypothetical protein HHK36_016037 [Tetracentron sinense]
MVAIAAWPTWIVVAVSETLRKVVTYVVTRPGRELLFTVVSQDEKYKAKVCIDVIVQRLGDATAAGMYKLLFSTHNRRISRVSLCVSCGWSLHSIWGVAKHTWPGFRMFNQPKISLKMIKETSKLIFMYYLLKE